MFEDQPKIISSAPAPQSAPGGFSNSPRLNIKKIILIAVLAFFIIAVIVIIVAVIKKRPAGETGPTNPANPINQTSTSPTLPGQDDIGNSQASSTSATTSLSSLAIERLSFADFYQAPDNRLETTFPDYQLPLNIKMDVMNYYDISRKLSLDPVLEDLNNQGAALLSNPWSTTTDFYSVYERLNAQQVPLLITSDFIVYYYQNVFKKAFKDIEENIFYGNLWDISKELYESAKNRYEARLAAIGNVNDSVLEGERLAVAYLAVALELLKPAANQVAAQGSLEDKTKFSAFEADRFYFMIPPYLRTDVLREVELIRSAKEKLKSPVLLYTRDYSTFSIASDYRLNAKLNNFYLTTKWLSSPFPLETRTKSCPNCLLDQEDNRINLIAASLLATDFYNAPELKAKWARIYKIMAFFKGLREDLNYLHYRDSLITLFGSDYNLEELFKDDNPEADNNLNKLRNQLLAYDFPAIQGAWNKQSSSGRPNLGLKILADYYWPNSYLFENLVTPNVGAYQGSGGRIGNITACGSQRCLGIALDIINLAHPIAGSAYFSENTNYTNYNQAYGRLKSQLAEKSVWRSTSYWTTLGVIQSFLAVDKQALPRFASTPFWQEKSLQTAVSAWINLQLPLEVITVRQDLPSSGLNAAAAWADNSYIEPNWPLINELLANNEMLLKMLTALRLNEELPSVAKSLQDLGDNLSTLKEIMHKELTGASLSPEDNEAMIRFTRQYSVKPANRKDKQLLLAAGQKIGPKEDISQLKLLVLIHQEGESKIIAVGPAWHYIENLEVR